MSAILVHPQSNITRIESFNIESKKLGTQSAFTFDLIIEGESRGLSDSHKMQLKIMDTEMRTQMASDIITFKDPIVSAHFDVPMICNCVSIQQLLIWKFRKAMLMSQSKQATFSMLVILQSSSFSQKMYFAFQQCQVHTN
ncbi:hypothetical protein FGO68_gene1722 [Halteria grandinella]|uniref:Uncharacterized protein n=1 Tax=Halteria grandinella TaxID=5974 RepID=A0A8J8NF29_HALGN|nr:hypothetical protein FGO68_gene1722 [Halteria grandinella]